MVVIVINMEKIVIFNRIACRFVKSFTAYPAPKELFCEMPEDAHDFKSAEKAREWADQSGFFSLAILRLMKN